MRRLALLIVLLFSPFALAGDSKIPPPPETLKKPATETFFGIKVIDNYQWLENNDDPQVKAWVAEQDKRARDYINGVSSHTAIKDWLTELMHKRSVSYYEIQPASGQLFAMKSQPDRQQDTLVVLKSTDPKTERTVMDPNVVDKSGSTSIQFFVPSVDGKMVAVCLAEGGSESGNVHVYETATGKPLTDVVERVNFPTAGGSVSWNAQGTGFYYTRYPHEGDRPPQDMNFYQQVYFHKLGTPGNEDTYVIGKDFPRIAEIYVDSGTDGRYLLVMVENGDGGEYEHYLRNPEGKWTQVTHFADGISAAAIGRDQALYLVSRKDAPRGKLLRVSLSNPELEKAEVVVPESKYVIQGLRFSISGFPPNFAATKERLYVVDVNGGPQQIRIFDHGGKELGIVPIEPVSSVGQVVALDDGNLLFRNTSYTKPAGWYLYNPAQNKTSPTMLSSTSPVSMADVEVKRETAISKDGAEVPMSILYKRGLKLDGSHPALLTGYGGFGISISPGFNPSIAPWLNAGGVFAVGNIRGGGEFGEEWHRDGMLTKKQNVFNDFIACSEHLIKAGYTNPKKLGIEGGSNGGLLMGAVLTQRPDLYRAVLSVAGLYDMLRFETTQNGQFNTTEYGSVKDLDQFKALHAYSPYNNVKPDTAYPAVLLTVGENDLRVDPWHSRKFAAALQADTTSALPVLLITYSNAGHGGIGSSEDMEIMMATDGWTFQFDQLGVPFRPVPFSKSTESR